MEIESSQHMRFGINEPWFSGKLVRSGSRTYISDNAFVLNALLIVSTIVSYGGMQVIRFIECYCAFDTHYRPPTLTDVFVA